MKPQPMALGRGRCPGYDSLQTPALGAMAAGGRLALGAVPRSSWVRGSGPAILSRLREAAVVRPGFLSAAEEETLSRELEPELRRRRYEYDHWDAVRPAAMGAGPRAGLRRRRGQDVRGEDRGGAPGRWELRPGAGPAAWGGV